MNSNAKAGILALSFTCIFLMIFPAFLDRWPTIFGIACVFLFIPKYMEGNGRGWNYRLLISVLICGINMALILVFCDKSMWIYQISVYLAASAACLFTLSIKRMIMRRKEEQ